MYPDTDTPPFPIPDVWVDEARSRPIHLPWEAEARYRGRGLSAAAAERLVGAPWAGLFDVLAPETPICARRLAAALEKRLVHHWRRSGTRELSLAPRLAPLVRAVDAGAVRPEAFEAAFDRLLARPSEPPAAIVAELAVDGHEAERLDRAVADVVQARSTLVSRDPAAMLRWAMGRAMPSLLGRVEPARVRAQLARGLEVSR
jgi:Glu-tRNA(Gln) amidotransferase subunit E-like FAD-binding protein